MNFPNSNMLYRLWPPNAAITSSTETYAPANVPRNNPYLSVSFNAKTTASSFVNTPAFLKINAHKKRSKSQENQNMLAWEGTRETLSIKPGGRPQGSAALQPHKNREQREPPLQASAYRETLGRCLDATPEPPPLLVGRPTNATGEGRGRRRRRRRKRSRRSTSHPRPIESPEVALACPVTRIPVGEDAVRQRGTARGDADATIRARSRHGKRRRRTIKLDCDGPHRFESFMAEWR